MARERLRTKNPKKAQDPEEYFVKWHLENQIEDTSILVERLQTKIGLPLMPQSFQKYIDLDPTKGAYNDNLITKRGYNMPFFFQKKPEIALKSLFIFTLREISGVMRAVMCCRKKKNVQKPI